MTDEREGVGVFDRSSYCTWNACDVRFDLLLLLCRRRGFEKESSALVWRLWTVPGVPGNGPLLKPCVILLNTDYAVSILS